MSDRIDLGAAPWDAIPRTILRDERLSPRAKGGLVTLLSHDDGWVRSAIAILQRENRCGRAQAQAIMKELRDIGYAELITERNLEGRIASHYVVKAVPSETGSDAGTSEFPVAGIPARRDSRPPVTQAAVVDPQDVDPLDVDPKEPLAVAPRRRDEVFEALAEIEGSDLDDLTRSQRGALNKAAKELRDLGVDPEAIPRRAQAFGRRYPGATITALALVRHWAELGGSGGPDTRPDWQVWEEALAE